MKYNSILIFALAFSLLVASEAHSQVVSINASFEYGCQFNSASTDISTPPPICPSGMVPEGIVSADTVNGGIVFSCVTMPPLQTILDVDVASCPTEAEFQGNPFSFLLPGGFGTPSNSGQVNAIDGNCSIAANATSGEWQFSQSFISGTPILNSCDVVTFGPRLQVPGDSATLCPFTSNSANLNQFTLQSETSANALCTRFVVFGDEIDIPEATSLLDSLQTNCTSNGGRVVETQSILEGIPEVFVACEFDKEPSGRPLPRLTNSDNQQECPVSGLENQWVLAESNTNARVCETSVAVMGGFEEADVGRQTETFACQSAGGVVSEAFTTDNAPSFAPDPDARGFGYFVQCRFGASPSITTGRFSDFIDSRVVRACDASCTQEVEQTRQCIGAEVGDPGCEGELTQLLERSCEPGEGMCPFNKDTVGTVQNNSLITPETPEASAAIAIENICPQLQLSGTALTPEQQDLAAQCNNIIAEQDELAQLGGVQGVLAEEVASQGVNLRRVNLAQLSNIASRLAALRPALLQTARSVSQNGELVHPLPGYAGVSPSLRQYREEQYRLHGIETGGAAGDEPLPEASGRWGVYVNGLYGRGDRRQTRNVSGFDFDNLNITVGADYLLSPSTIVGLAIGYGEADTLFGGGEGSLETDTNTLSVYGSHYFGNSWFVDGVVGYGSSDYLNRRNINYVANNVSVTQTAEGRPDGSQVLLSAGVAKTLTAKSAIDWDFSLRLNHLDAEIDRFAERILGSTGPGLGLALEIDDQDIRSTTAEFGVGISKPFSMDFGVLVPSLNLFWLHEFEDGTERLRARFLNDPFSVNFVQSGLDVSNGGLPTIFEIALDANDSDYGRAQLGFNMLFPSNWTFTFQMNSTLGLESIDYQYYSFGLRKSF